jgi:hypothetical protein
MPGMSLLESTNSLLEKALSSGVKLRDIAIKSNGRVDYEWLKKYSQGNTKDPSVNRIQALHDSLQAMQGFPQ